MSDKMMVDIQRLSNIEKEIEIIEKRKISAQYELDRIEQECVKLEQESEKKVEQELAKIKIENDFRNGLLSQRTNAIDDREKNIILMEIELNEIHKSSEDLKIEKVRIAAEWKNIESTKSAYLESKHNADLLIEQYTAKLNEIKV